METGAQIAALNGAGRRLAAAAAGWPAEPFAAPFAADGISELLTCFITRPGGSLRARLLGVRCTTLPGSGW